MPGVLCGMNLLDIVSPEGIVSPLQATSKKGAIEELVDVLAKLGKVQDASVLKDAVWQREQTKTTGIGLGLAIPHGRCSGIQSIAMAMGKPASPMEFDAIDGKPVRVIVLLASPPDKTSDHIQALARISRLMSDSDFREKMYKASTGAEMYELLRGMEKP